MTCVAKAIRDLICKRPMGLSWSDHLESWVNEIVAVGSPGVAETFAWRLED
jgi:hypothetical protein